MNGLSVKHLTKQYGNSLVLSDVSLTAQPGEILGLIGPNGAGKTTLLECIAGLLSANSGTVEYAAAILPPEMRKQVLWYQPDDILPYALQRVSVTLAFFQNIHCRNRDTLDSLIDRLDLSPMLGKPLQSLSKGYRRRVLLAIALLSRQQLLLLDEPFDGFDLRQSLAVMDLLRECRTDRTMILSIHQLSEAEKICDRFLLLNAGKVPALGTLDELRIQAHLASGAGLEEIFLALT